MAKLTRDHIIDAWTRLGQLAHNEGIAVQILARNPLEVRSLMQDYLRQGAPLRLEHSPTSDDPRVRAVAAGIAELIAARTTQPAPAWANEIGGLPMPLYLVDAATR